MIEKIFLLLSAMFFLAACSTDKEYHIETSDGVLLCRSSEPADDNFSLSRQTFDFEEVKKALGFDRWHILPFVSFADAFPGEVGIAMISGRDTVCINGNAHFPMFSVVKFHQALAVGNHFRTIGTEMPDEIKGLLDRTLIVSDNAACDALFETVAGPAQVEEYIHGLGIKDCGLVWTEAEQHEDIGRCAGNWTTPLSAACLLGKFYENRSVDSLSEYIWDNMTSCSTGADRIPKYISGDVVSIAHKTGTGAPLPGGGTMGIGDIACIVLPDGRHFELAVFVKDASCDAPTCEEMIAQVARICYESISPANGMSDLQ